MYFIALLQPHMLSAVSAYFTAPFRQDEKR
jgi:hypothetical protein